ncbi:MAG: hypothetical protein NZL85_09200 [Fimbriimonadales bacterium]|nr:hypothetical protein [Fimbriimonadales bacterium]
MGLYVGYFAYWRYNAFTGINEFRAHSEYWLLLSGGRIYFGKPTNGVDRFDWERAKREDPKNCGAYRVANGRIQFEWKGEAVAFPKDAKEVKVKKKFGTSQVGNSFRRVEPCNGCRLSGSYRRTTYVNLTVNPNIEQRDVSGEHTITFTQDGRFTLEGFSGFTSTHQEIGGAAGSTKTAQSGTYRIYNYTIELSFSDGRRETLLFFRYPGEEEEAINIGGATFTRRK